MPAMGQIRHTKHHPTLCTEECGPTFPDAADRRGSLGMPAPTDRFHSAHRVIAVHLQLHASSQPAHRHAAGSPWPRSALRFKAESCAPRASPGVWAQMGVAALVLRCWHLSGSSAAWDRSAQRPGTCLPSSWPLHNLVIEGGEVSPQAQWCWIQLQGLHVVSQTPAA